MNDLAACCTIPVQKESCPHSLPWPYAQHPHNFNLSPSNVLTRTPEAKTFYIPKCFLEIRPLVVKKCYQLRTLLNSRWVKTWSPLIGLLLAHICSISTFKKSNQGRLWRRMAFLFVGFILNTFKSSDKSLESRRNPSVLQVENGLPPFWVIVELSITCSHLFTHKCTPTWIAMQFIWFPITR